MLINFEKICRACMLESAELIPIWSSNAEEELTTSTILDQKAPREDMFNEFTIFHASFNDELPKKFCIDCLVNMEHAFIFKRKCERSDVRLRTHLKLFANLPRKIDRDSPVPNKRSVQINRNIGFHRKERENEIELASCEENEKVVTVHQHPPLSGQLMALKNMSLEMMPPLLKCGLCTAKFTQTEALERHRRSHPAVVIKLLNFANDLSQVSATNAKCLVTNNKVQNHKRPTLPHVCDHCTATFSNQRWLKIHVRQIHAMAQLWEEKELNLHAKSNKRVENVKPNICSKRKRKSHVCDICGKSFLFLHKIRNHMKNHTGTKPFQCNICSASFYRNNDLKCHIRIHTDERPFICKTCGNSFNRLSNLKRHLITRKHV